MNKVIGMVKPETTVTRQEMYTNESLHWRSEHIEKEKALVLHKHP